MRRYELMIVLNVSTAADDDKKQLALVKKLLADQEISDLTVSQWAKRSLAYEIKKQTEGIFVLAEFSCEQIHINKIEQQVKLQSDILRYLLTRKEETK